MTHPAGCEHEPTAKPAHGPEFNPVGQPKDPRATMEQDEQECADQLQNLASCIPFVSGSAKKPTQQCCDDTGRVRSKKPKCLCVLIKESTDPTLALPINTTLALQMPSACNIDAKVSDCPALLELRPDSPDAKIFKDASKEPSSTASPTSPATSSSPSTASPTTTSSSDSKAAPTANKSSRLKVLQGASVAFFLVSFACAVVV
ncbi:hypothetical protein ACLOJK_031865 [Asimina triloba]